MADGRNNPAALPMLYIVLGTVAVSMQWTRWHALHRTRNLVALLLAVTAVVVAATYLLRGLRQARRIAAAEPPLVQDIH